MEEGLKSVMGCQAAERQSFYYSIGRSITYIHERSLQALQSTTDLSSKSAGGHFIVSAAADLCNVCAGIQNDEPTLMTDSALLR